MLVKKPVHTLSPAGPRGYQRELQLLYARRSAVDSLIASLQSYHRFHEQRSPEPKRKLA